MPRFVLDPDHNFIYKTRSFMKKLFQTILVSTFALAGTFQFVGCAEPVAEDPPEAAEEESEEEPEGGDGPAPE